MDKDKQISVKNDRQLDNQQNITQMIKIVDQDPRVVNSDENNYENEQVVLTDNENGEEICDVEVKEEVINEFDSFGDGEMVYRKYRLRDRNHKPVKTEYEPEPIHLPPSKIRYDHQDNFPCDKCSMVLDSRTGLLNHMRTHIAKANIKYTCAICQEQFNTNNLLKKHKTAHDNCIFTCQQCQVAFSDHCDYVQHEISHTLRSSYKCSECGLYYNKTSYLIHINTHYDRKIQCHICNTLIQKYNMQNHMKDHNLKKCIECNKLMKPSMMKYHMISHTGVKMFQCLYCGKGFSNSNQRLVHTRVHTNERPFECDICNAKFKQSGDVKKHRVAHFDGKFTCNICDKKFIHKDSLVSHLSVHNGAQKYKCDICGYKPSTYAGYKTHMLYKHSKEKTFKCVHCDVYFKSKVALNKHSQKSIKHKRNMFKSKLEQEKSFQS